MTRPDRPTFSFLLPTRDRVKDLVALLESIQATTRHPERLEIILGIDEDDAATRELQWPGLAVKKTILPKGLTMGAMNNACYAASSGRYVMLMNDDMLLHTNGWDDHLARTLEPIGDDIFLAHVNDLLFKDKLCCFPMLSRTFCELAGGVCPTYYERYRIDDHIYNVFNLLALAGHRRIYYFPDVIFEHLNFEAKGAADKEYLYHKPTLNRDAQRFDDTFPERKALATALADHIEAARAKDLRAAREKVLAALPDADACRNPGHARRVATASIQASAVGTRVTLGVVCSDIRHTHTQTCINFIKANTSNYELVVLDNAHDPNFNHAREMNRLLEFSRNAQVVLLDDDVYVAPGWLEDMQSALTGNVGCVTPVHLDSGGRLSYAGVYVGLEDQGDHAHLMEVASQPMLTPTLCSAVMLIDMNRCGHLRFDEGCLKYFHDLDYGLQVWDSGSAVAVNTKVPVTHLGGATLKQGSSTANTFIDRDRQVFVSRWLETGRLDRLREQWRQVPDLDRLYALPDRFAELLEPSRLGTPAWKQEVLALLGCLGPIPALRTTFLGQIKKCMFSPATTPDAGTALRWARSVAFQGEEKAEELTALKIRIAILVDQWQAGDKRVLVYPAGALTASLLRDTRLLHANIVGLGDTNRFLEGEEMCGKLIVAPASVPRLNPDVVLVASKAFQEEIIKVLRPLLPPSVELVRLYEPEALRPA